MPTISYTIPSDMKVGTAVTITPMVADGTLSASETWSVTTGTLPAGLTISSTTGEISGTPTAAGTSTFTVTATDGTTPITTSPTMTVAAASATAYTLTAPDGDITVGTPVTLSLSLVGGVPDTDVTVTLSDGDAGGTFDSNTVVFKADDADGHTRQYTAAGETTATITATNSGTLANPASLSLVSVLPASSEINLSGPTSSTAGVAVTLYLTADQGGPASDDVITPSDGGAGGLFTPATVTIPKGTHTAVSFTYTPADSSDGKTVTISATDSLSLGVSGSVKMSVAPNPAHTYQIAVPDAGYVNRVSTVSVTLGASPAAATTVTLSDGGAGGTFSPATLTFAAGSTGAQTSAYTPSKTGTATISGTNSGSLINPAGVALPVGAEPTDLLTLSGADNVTVGDSYTLTVTPNKNGPTEDTVVTPDDKAAGGTFTPETVTIPKGSTTAALFAYKPAILGGGTTVQLEVKDSLSLETSGAVTVKVNPNPNLTYQTSLSATRTYVGKPVTVTVQPGGTGPAQDTVISFSDGGAGGTFTPATVTIPKGTTAALTTSYAPSANATVTMMTTNNGGLIDAGTLTLTVAPRDADSLQLEGPTGVVVGGAAAVSVIANYNGPLAETTVTFSDSGAGGTFTPATVTLAAGQTTAAKTSYAPPAGYAGKNVTISITNSANLTNSNSLTVAVNAQTSENSITYNIPGRINVGDVLDITAIANTNIPANATWSVTTGALPDGMSINSSTGDITGTPSTAAAGTTTFTVTASNGTSSLTGVISLKVYIPTTIEGTPLSGKINAPFSFTFSVDGDSTAVATLANDSALPNGVTFDGPTMTIKGTPLEGGHFIADVVADGTNSHAERVFDLLIVTTPTLDYGSINKAVKDTVSIEPTYDGTSGVCTFSVYDGALANGLELNPTTGVISGTLTTAGVFTATIKITDATGGESNALVKMNIVDQLTITMPDLTTAFGVAANVVPTVVGGQAPYTFSLTGDTLSAVQFDTTTGQVSTAVSSPVGTEVLTIKVADAIGASQTQSFNVTINQKITLVAPGKIPPGDIGTPYTLTVPVEGGIGAQTSKISTGSLPPGLSLQPNTTVISGTPTTDGSYNATLQVTDSSGTSTLPLNITISKALQVESSFPYGIVGVPYSHQIQTDGGYSDKEYEVTGTLPPGLEVNEATGVIFGTPTAPGTSALQVTVTDGVTAAEAAVVMSVVSPVSVSYSAAYGYPNTAMIITPSVKGGHGTVSFTSADLPDGFTIDGSTGVITGTPAAAMTATVNITTTDDTGTTSEACRIVVLNHLFVTDTTVYPVLGEPFSFNVGSVVSGGDTTKSFTSASVFPTGLTFDASTGVISGTVNGAPTSKTVQVQVTDTRETKMVNINIQAINTISLKQQPPTGVVGEAYSYTLAFTGGSGKQTIAMTSTLPAGLTYDPTTQTISGTPTISAVAALAYSCTDATGSISGVLTLNIGPEIGIAGDPVAAEVGHPYTFTPSVAGGTGDYTFSYTGTLPAGLNFNKSSGAIFGTPTIDALANITITVNDGIETASFVAGIVVKKALTVSNLISITCPKNKAFSQFSTAQYGAGPLTYAQVAGTLPPGVNLNVDTGVLSGTPTQSGLYTFSIQVSDLYTSEIQQFTISVVNAGIPSGLETPTQIDLTIDTLIEQYVTIMTNPASTSAAKTQALTYLARANRYMISWPTVYAMTAFWTLNQTYGNSIMSESNVFQYTAAVDPVYLSELTAVYTAYHGVIAYPSKELDLSFLIRTTRCQALVTFLEVKRRALLAGV